jgi:hypothetical protein
MEETQTQPLALTAEEELEQIKKRQQELQRRISEQQQEKTKAQILALSDSAKRRREEEEQERLVLQEIARKRKERELAEQEEQKRLAEESAKARAERDTQLQKAKEELRKREEAKELLRLEREKAAQMEREVARLQREIETGFVAPEEEKQVTIESPEHPLARTLHKTQEQPLETAQGIDSVELAKNQSAERAEEIKNKARSAWRPVPKSQHFVDSGASAELEQLLRRELRINANPQRLDLLSAYWDYADLMKAAEIVVEVAKARPMGHDQLLSYIQATLEGAASA